MKKLNRFAVVTVALLSSVGYVAGAHAESRYGFGPLSVAPSQGQIWKWTEPPVTANQAHLIALRAFPGKIVAARLQRDQQGKWENYVIDIRHGSKGREMVIDARNGHILTNHPLSPLA